MSATVLADICIYLITTVVHPQSKASLDANAKRIRHGDPRKPNLLRFSNSVQQDIHLLGQMNARISSLALTHSLHT